MIQTIDIWSDALGENTILKVVLPDDGCCQKLMVLLHGTMNPGEHVALLEQFMHELDLEELCEKQHMIIVTPSMKNSYYISTENYDCSRFVAQELLNFVMNKYHIPCSAELILAGVSMGGFGATLIGARTGIFRKILSISGSYIAHDVEIGNSEVWGELTPYSQNLDKSFLYYFLPLADVKESIERNALAALRLFSERKEKPVFVVTCGTEDWLYSRNIKFLDELEKNRIDYRFFPLAAGAHESECFKKGLWKAVEYLSELKG